MKTLLVQDTLEGGGEHRGMVESHSEVVSCRGTTAARQVASQADFAVIVLDLGDRREALEFCRWQREARPRRNRSFILVGLESGEAGASAEVIAGGADDLFVRPLTPAELHVRLASVARQLQQRAAWDQTEESLNSRAQQQVAVAALGQCALSEDLPTLIDLVSRFIIYTVDVEFCSLCEVQDEARNVKLVAGFGWREGMLGHVMPPPSGRSLLGRTLLGEDLIVEDLAHDIRFTTPDFLNEHGVVSGVSVAIKGKETGVFGALGAFTSQRRQFLDDDLRFLEGLANVLGSAIERQRTQAELQKRQSQVQHLQRLESVGQLAAALAHDYNNILAIIHGHVALALGESNLPTRLAASLKSVLEAVERASRLTRQLLSFSRKQSIELKAVDLNIVISDMARLLDRVLGRNIRLELQTSAGMPAVQADTGMLDQVVMNLAVNARDAMPDGGRLLIRTFVSNIETLRANDHPHARVGNFVCLTVTDTGTGMDEPTLRRLFDPFFTTKAPGKGTGLGLSTVYGIVKQHQGWIEVDSELGKGSTFRVFLPSHGTPAVGAIPPAAPAGSHQPTVLLVEDEPGLRDLTRMLLEDLGCEVAEAGSAQEAFALWSTVKEKVSILLTDLILTDGVTGFELAEQLQKERPNLKVLLTSGYSAEDISKDYSARSGFHFIQKPYGKETLARTLQVCFAENGRKAVIRSPSD